MDKNQLKTKILELENQNTKLKNCIGAATENLKAMIVKVKSPTFLYLPERIEGDLNTTISVLNNIS
jgi:hypothetical protein